MAAILDGYKFSQSRGLYVPETTGGSLVRDVADYSAQLAKAREERPLTTKEEAMWKRMGSFFTSYYSAFRNMATFGAAQKPPGTASHRILRETARQSIVDSLIINARLMQVRHVAKKVLVEGKEKGWKVKHKCWNDSGVKVTPAMKRIAEEIEDAICAAVNTDVHPAGLRDILVMMTQGQMVIDRTCLIVQRDRRNRPLSIHLLPPDNIRPRLEVLVKFMPGIDPNWQMRGAAGQAFRYKREQYEQAAESIFRQFDVDVSRAAFVQEIDNVVLGAWTKEECAVGITNPSDETNQWGFGISNLERSLEATTMLLHAFNYNKTQFTSNYPEAFLMLNGDVDLEGLESFRSQIYADVGPGGNMRLPVFATGDTENTAQLLKLRDSLKEMSFIESIDLLCSFKLSAYRAHRSLLNLSANTGASGPPVIDNKDEAFAIDLAQEEGLGSLLEDLAAFLTRELIEPVEEWRDYKWVFLLDEEQSESQMVDLWTKETTTFATIDEARAAMGKPPLIEATQGKVSGAYVNNAFFFQAQQQQMAELQAQLQAMQQQMNGMGQPGANGNGQQAIGGTEADAPYGQEQVVKANRLQGGMADFDPEALAEGIRVEREHTKDPDLAREIAMDHLAEDPRYYEKLKKVAL